jgi:hypothetical protein
MLAKRSILKPVVIFFILIWFADVDAVIYQWKDANGITHFTDNPTNAPKAFRKKPFIKDLLPQRKISGPKEKNAQRDRVETMGEEKPVKNEIKIGKKEGLTEEQRSVVEGTINFLQADIPRYEKFYTYTPSRSKFRALKQVVAGATAQKQELLDQVKKHDIPVLKTIAEYLSESITADKRSQKVMPTTITSTRQTLTLINRLKGEAENEKQLLTTLTSVLNTKK